VPFELFRLSLVERQYDIIDFIEASVETPSGARRLPETNRETWLREVLSHEISFVHRRIRFHYVPDPDLTAQADGILVGRIGRKRTAKENDPPESGLKETERTVWHAMLIAVDPTSHGDGQKVAIERDATVATCYAVLKSLANAVNKLRPATPYVVTALPLTEGDSFWEFVREHHVITSLTFEMIAPNMFGLQDDWDADMKALKEIENADKAKFQTESRDGLKVDNPRVRKGVEHTARGTATLKARAADHSTYSSENSIRTTSVEGSAPDDISWSELMRRIVRRIFRV
jgi:hypothetical protein